MYEGEVSLAYNIWSCYGLNVCDNEYDEQLDMEGITKSIELVTSDSNKNITLEKTNCWTDKETYQDTTSHYLIEVELCADKILHEELHPLRIDNQRLVLKLDGISKDKIKKIEAFIEKLL